ncbi:MAG TPA: hypothetical protein VKK79_03495 [Candidatus Lokiarchaeia archaeon]|nr:hypothetical protein [Candidatus Lokiarchaeia archaeon]
MTVHHKTRQTFFDGFMRQRSVLINFLEFLPDDRARSEYAQLLLNRLLFLHFMQQKDLLDQNESYLQDKLQQCVDGGQLFYTDFCQPHLFPALSDGNFHEQICGAIPFLGVDLFLLQPPNVSWPDVPIPNDFFKQFFAFLADYQWSPDEKPVSGNEFVVSPKVLGYIFEKNVNTLSSGKIGHKASGAYYTPAIVATFMAEQAILPTIQCRVEEHLRTHFETYADLFDESRNPNVRMTCLYLFTEVLPGFSVLDNACGAGAFLVSALQVLVRVWTQVTFPILGEPAVRDAILADSAAHNSGSSGYFRQFDDVGTFMTDAHWRYYFTRQVMTHNLYGVDLEVGAVNTAKMRLWLSLIAEIGEKDVNIARVVPLPTLDAHLRSGNSLVGYITDRKQSGVSS